MIEILRCEDCGRVVLSVDTTRVTDHKCSGSYEVLHTIELNKVELERAWYLFSSLLRKANGLD